MQTKSLFVVSTVLLFGAVAFIADAADWNPLSDTGQANCYDVMRNIIACPAEGQALHGQDAQYYGRPQNFQDNGNGTVTDHNTTLMWQQTDDGTQRTWQDAIDYCTAFDDGTYDNWRLPEIFELRSIVDYGRSKPAINPVFSCQSSDYWSATPHAVASTVAWPIYFFNGSANLRSSTDTFYVRCVRAGL